MFDELWFQVPLFIIFYVKMFLLEVKSLRNMSHQWPQAGPEGSEDGGVAFAMREEPSFKKQKLIATMSGPEFQDSSDACSVSFWYFLYRNQTEYGIQESSYSQIRIRRPDTLDETVLENLTITYGAWSFKNIGIRRQIHKFQVS